MGHKRPIQNALISAFKPTDGGFFTAFWYLLRCWPSDLLKPDADTALDHFLMTDLELKPTAKFPDSGHPNHLILCPNDQILPPP